MPILKKITRFPIKGLSGENINKILLEENQVLPGDREFAFARSHVLFDEKNPVYLRKTNFLALVQDEKLAELKTTFDHKLKRLIIKIKEETVLDEIMDNDMNRHKVETFFQKHLDLGEINKPMLVQGTKSENNKDFKHSFSDLPDRVISIINMNTIYDLEKKIGKKIDPSRFRANLLIDDIDPWKEFDWVGKKIKIGETVLEVFKRTQRCAATNVNPETALRDINIPHEIKNHFGHLDLGVYAKVKKTGIISVNDELIIN
jgi:uncharacterized protein YcbX